MADLITASGQYLLDLKIEKEVEIDGFGMGVLNDGTPYLLDEACAVARCALNGEG